MREDIREAIVLYGDKIPDGESTRLRGDLPEDLSEGEGDIIDYYESPKPIGYSIIEWRELIGEEAVGAALLVWNKQDITDSAERELQTIAREYGITYDELILSIGRAGY